MIASMNLKKFLALLLLVVGWYYVTPYQAASSMREAAKEGNATALARYVDLAAVAESLKSAVTDSLPGEDPRQVGRGASPSERGPAGRLVEAMLSPQGMLNLLRAERVSAGNEAPGEGGGLVKPEDTKDKGDAEVVRRYVGWNTFEVVASKKDKPEARFRLVMSRTGFSGWRLSAIELPAR